MKKTLLTLTLAVAVALGVVVNDSFVYAADTYTVAPGESIQDAINNASDGDTIIVSAGTYAGTFNVNKAINLHGAQAGIDARDRSGAETVIMSANSNGGFNITSPGVTIDGFTVDGSSPTATYARGITLTGADVSGLTVVNNIFRHNQTAVSTSTSVVADVTGLQVSQNAFIDNFSPAAAPSGGTFISNVTGSDIVISSNSYSGTNGSSGSSNAIVVSGQSGSLVERVVISGNTSSNDGSFVYVYNASQVQITNNQSSDQAGNGVLLGDDTSSVSIADNVFSDSNNGIRFGGAGPISNVTISNNTITDMGTAGVMVSEGVDIEDIVVIDNSFTGNAAGVINGTSTAVDANDNWWGCEAGPGADGCDSIDGVVLASSWYVDDSLTTTNLDVSDEEAPGVPNTGFIGSSSWSLLVAGLVAVAAATGGVVYYRRSVN